MKNPIYTYKGKRYEIVREECDSPDQPNRADGLLRDFLYCESKGDWDTIKNRIINGTMWGWLKEIGEDEKGFW
jgi:hypothetical protein